MFKNNVSPDDDFTVILSRGIESFNVLLATSHMNGDCNGDELTDMKFENINFNINLSLGIFTLDC